MREVIARVRQELTARQAPPQVGPAEENLFAFDLPDNGHFYPGDRLRYIIAAEDAIGGVTHSLPPIQTYSIRRLLSLP